jgi:hypothetical protein
MSMADPSCVHWQKLWGKINQVHLVAGGYTP